MEEEARAEYGTSSEVVVTLKNGDDEVSFKIPNALDNLSSDSSVVTNLVSVLTSEPETSDEFKLFVVNNKGQMAKVENVVIDVVQTTRTKVYGN